MSAAESAAGLALVELLALAAARWGTDTANRLEGPIVAMLNERDARGGRKWSNEQIGWRVCQLIYGGGKPDPRVLTQGTGIHVPDQPVRTLPGTVTAQYAALAKQGLAEAAAAREAERLEADAARRAAEAEDAAQDGAA